MSFEGFYPAILATFVHIERTYGCDVLERYWRELAEQYYEPTIEQFRAGGLTAVADHWDDYFSKEPQAKFKIIRQDDRVVVDIEQCPAIFWLTHFKCDIPDWYCRHCDVMGNALASCAGLRFEFENKGGRCKFSFVSKDDSNARSE